MGLHSPLSCVRHVESAVTENRADRISKTQVYKDIMFVFVCVFVCVCVCVCARARAQINLIHD